MEKVEFQNIRITDGFWRHYQDMNKKVTLPSIYSQFKETGRFDGLDCASAEKTHIYWDSDVAKWIEAASYVLHDETNDELERIIDKAADDIIKNQLDTGYYNSYYIANCQDKIFKIRDNHELYCAGHLIEAAIAYHKATGKRALLDAMIKYADYIYKVFYKDKSAGFFTPGHEEIELALLKLADHTGDEKYVTLAEYFIEERGRHPEEVCEKVEDALGEDGDYYRWLTQSKEPVREMDSAYGHAVRACYLYTAIADLAKKRGDRELRGVVNKLYIDVTERKLSITGGIGAQIWGEAFGLPYRLSLKENYNETCAAISLIMFLDEMRRIEEKSEYSDLIEKILYNGMISGISLSSDAFFYENALEIDKRDYDISTRNFKSVTVRECHVRGLLHKRRLERSKVFNCSCCPPNIARIISSIAKYMYSVDGNTVFCNQFIPSVANLKINGEDATLTLKTNYPEDGALRYEYHGPSATLAIRIPEWCVEYQGDVKDGYAYFRVEDGDKVEITLPMEIHFIEANERVSETAGRSAVTRGPIVYCLEEIDNGDMLWDITLKENGEKKVIPDPEFMVPRIEIEGERRRSSKKLYSIRTGERVSVTAKLIPYFAFANRGISDMQIFTQVE